MYKKFFGLRENPFNVNPDPRYLFLTEHTEEALASLTYGIQSRRGFILLTGEVGTGKTTILNKLLGWLQRQNITAAFLFNPRLSVAEFFDYMMADFGIPCDSSQKSQVLMRLNHWLLERYKLRETATMIIDEAQDLSLRMLEEIRLLTNLETATEKLLQIVLCGQPELEDKLRQLRQRITLRCKTYPLTSAETRGYILRRLSIAGAAGPAIFTPGAIEVIHRYSRGIPRVVNLLCEHALINAFVEQTRPIPADTVNKVAREFELDEIEPVARPHAARPGDRPLRETMQGMATLMDRLRRPQ